MCNLSLDVYKAKMREGTFHKQDSKKQLDIEIQKINKKLSKLTDLYLDASIEYKLKHQELL